MSNTSLLQDRTDEDDDGTRPPGGPTRVHRYPLRAVAAGILGAAAVAGLAVGGWRFHATADELDVMRADADSRAHAEQVALDYATGAAQMDFHDLDAWKNRLVTGTTPELEQRLTQAATSMEQIVVPLQWTSTAQPITAKAQAAGDGIYTVDCFVSVFTSNAQAPEGIQSTATYRLSIDGTDDWTITDISGVGPDLDPSAVAPR